LFTKIENNFLLTTCWVTIGYRNKFKKINCPYGLSLHRHKNYSIRTKNVGNYSKRHQENLKDSYLLRCRMFQIYQVLYPIHHKLIAHFGRISSLSGVHQHRFTDDWSRYTKTIHQYCAVFKYSSFFPGWSLFIQFMCYRNKQYLISRVCNFDLKVETLYKY